MRLAHLSDFHLGGPDPKRRQRVERLVSNVLDDHVDDLLLGGDLVDSANLSDAQPLMDVLVDRGFSSSDRLSVVPGNHDIWPYREDNLVGAGLASFYYDSLKRIVGGDWPAQKNYERFGDFFRATFSGSERHYKTNPYPCIKTTTAIPAPPAGVRSARAANTTTPGPAIGTVTCTMATSFPPD